MAVPPLNHPYGFFVTNRPIHTDISLQEDFYNEGLESFSLVVEVLHEVAFTGTSPSDPSGKLYLRVKVTGYVGGGWYNNTPGVHFGTKPLATPGGVQSDALITPKMVFKLKDSSPSCALYGSTSSDYISGGTDLVLEAKEWWPYAKLGGVPAWDKDTGAPL